LNKNWPENARLIIWWYEAAQTYPSIGTTKTSRTAKLSYFDTQKARFYKHLAAAIFSNRSINYLLIEAIMCKFV